MEQMPSGTQLLQPSLLDRLFDDEPTSPQETPRSAGQILRELKQAVRRDLEYLLNTRWKCLVLPPGLEQLEFSLVNYGIPDFTSSDFDAANKADELLEMIRRSIMQFEPRLKDLHLERLSDSTRKLDRTFRFRIDATLLAEPYEDVVRYDTSLEPTTGDFRVEGGAA